MTNAADAPQTLTFDVVGHADRLELSSFDLVVAGYTGSDEASVKKHIDELAAIGVPPPESVPAFYELASTLVTQSTEIEVMGTNTSGEVEPVLVRSAGRLYLGVGSDHTDRDIERTSVADSKAACPKPLSTAVVALELLDWDAVEAHCTVDGADYQRGSLKALRRTTDVLASYDAHRGGPERDLVMYGGTLPIIDGAFVPGTDWTMSLTLPDGSRLSHSYATHIRAS